MSSIYLHSIIKVKRILCRYCFNTTNELSTDILRYEIPEDLLLQELVPFLDATIRSTWCQP